VTTPVTVVFFDGVCGLCDRLVQFLLPRDRHARLRFAPLQSDLARRTLLKHGLDPSNLDSVVVVSNWGLPPERAFTRSGAVLHTLEELGGGWRVLARAAGIVPLPIANAAYALIARSRYRIFGRFDACRLPRPEWRDRFLGDQERPERSESE
jgi:predicted DCC family thiol-disulfide oxidoreductase YuxK